MIHTLSVSIHNISFYDTKTYICEEQEPNVPVIASSLYSLDGYNYTYDSSDDEEEEKPKVFNDFIDPIYRHSFEFGAMNIPAISVLITVTPKIFLIFQLRLLPFPFRWVLLKSYPPPGFGMYLIFWIAIKQSLINWPSLRLLQSQWSIHFLQHRVQFRTRPLSQRVLLLSFHLWKVSLVLSKHQRVNVY